ncbi:flagellin N-terminal helical domain-containing protein [Novosphingobium beihaiensis]|uniref:Flagellin n=1 Tax=Novosphingobium beihaiensis TaxID=2930389 RepID=A0ABT0BU30_9SPHN|nr:flagellin [Novosphingobium beihaiensis]MCJ2188189.1 flagellin [Novosphingobium beihaiensis]
MTIIGTNITAMRAAMAANSADAAQQKAMERLSTGKRINSAADDAAGLAISTSMTSQINGLSVSMRNISDGLSMLQTADGALGEVTNILQRMRELTVQAASGTYSTSDRAALQIEMDHSVQQVNSILGNSDFNGNALFSDTSNGHTADSNYYYVPGNYYEDEETRRINGGRSFQGPYQTGNADFEIQSGADSGDVVETSLDTLYSKSDNFAYLGKDMGFSSGNTRFVGISNIDLTAANSVDVRFIPDPGHSQNIDPSNYLSYSPTGSRSYNFKSQFTDSNSYGNTYAPLKVNANDGIAVLDAALQQVTAVRADIGAASSRLTSEMNVAQSQMTNLTEARSQIEDADYSEESVRLAKSQILAQASSAMISHANMNAKNVLDLLK